VKNINNLQLKIHTYLYLSPVLGDLPNLYIFFQEQTSINGIRVKPLQLIFLQCLKKHPKLIQIVHFNMAFVVC